MMSPVGFLKGADSTALAPQISRGNEVSAKTCSYNLLTAALSGCKSGEGISKIEAGRELHGARCCGAAELVNHKH